MTLIVNVFALDPAGGSEILDTPPGSCDLAGHERMRTDLWGSKVVRSIGARFLPELATGDLWIMPGDIAAFLVECELVRTNIPKIAVHTGSAEDYIAFRLNNMIAAARRAAELGGGIVI
jgi:hypothetical protein